MITVLIFVHVYFSTREKVTLSVKHWCCPSTQGPWASGGILVSWSCYQEAPHTGGIKQWKRVLPQSLGQKSKPKVLQGHPL